MVDTQSHEKLIAVIKGALVAALYAAVTLGLAPLSFGAIQFRLSEVFNKSYENGIKIFEHCL